MIKISKLNTRYNQVLIDGEWKDIPLLGVKKGMIFRLFEPTGELVYEGRAISDSYLDKNGIVGIQTESIEKL